MNGKQAAAVPLLMAMGDVPMFSSRRLARAAGIAVCETVILLTLSLHPILKHLLKGERCSRMTFSVTAIGGVVGRYVTVTVIAYMTICELEACVDRYHTRAKSSWPTTDDCIAAML